MKVAYIIIAHAQPGLVVRLVRALDSPAAHFYIHYDRKSPSVERRLIEEALAPVARVHMLPSHDVHWAGAGSIRATLAGIAAALDDGADVAALLSGQDYPIKPTAQVEQILAAAADAPFIQYADLSEDLLPGQTGRYQRWYFASLGVSIPHPLVGRVVRRRFPAGYRPYRGSAYWALPRDCLAHIQRVAHDEPRFVRFFRYVFAPDEMFFQTIVMNSRFASQARSDDLHFTDWTARGRHPAALTSAHLPALRASAQPFARKLDPRVDPGLLDAIDAGLRAGAAA